MTDPKSTRRLTALTFIVYWGCILLGLTLPLLATVCVDMAKHHRSFGQAFHQLQLHLFAPGYNLFLIAAMNAVPFILFSVVTLFHLGLVPAQDRQLASRRKAGILMSIVWLVGLSTWTHVMTLWYPDAQGALAYFFLPFVLLGLVPVGYAVGRGLGALMLR